MTLSFSPICMNDRPAYARLFAACQESSRGPTSDYSFVNLYGWATHHGLEFAFQQDAAAPDGLVWIRQSHRNGGAAGPLHWAPVGDWTRVDWPALLPEMAAMTGTGHFVRVPEGLADIWRERLGGRIEIAEDRDQWDYLYSAQELRELKGNKFHKKKNLLNQFLKSYEGRWGYSPMTPDCVEDALGLQDAWCVWRECEDSESLVAENEAVYRVLQSWDRLADALIGGAIRVDGKMVAFTVAEQLSPEMLVIHFEKASSDFKGVFQAINQQLLEHQGGRFTLVNREQDVGDEGLRQAKLSYNPVGFMKKYAARIV